MAVDGGSVSGDNTRHIRLARRALRQAITHLKNAENRTSTSDESRNLLRAMADALQVEVSATHAREREANEHMDEWRKRRRAARAA